MSVKKSLRRALAGLLGCAMLVSQLPVVSAAETEYPAPFEKVDSGMLTNITFDGEDNFNTDAIAAGKWYLFGGAKTVFGEETAHSGSNAVLLPAAGSAVDQRVELKPNTEYELKVWVKAEDGKGARVRAFLNGGEPKMLLDTDSNCFGAYYQYTNRFTTQADTTFANVGVVRASNDLATDGNVYVDDFSIEEVGAPVSATRTDPTTITVTYPESRQTPPTEEDVTLTYQTGEESAQRLDCTLTYDEETRTATITHPSVARDVETETTFELSLSSAKFRQTVTLPADESYVKPEIAEIRDLKNGSATIVLVQKPAVDLTTASVTIAYQDYDGNDAQAAVNKVEKVDDVTYRVEFGLIPAREQDKTYTLRFTVGESTAEGQLTVVTTAGKTFYLDATGGNDNNDGTSPETAWQSIEKVNSTTFLPGSQILLKCGETWTGMLWPKGSGAEGSPIILSSYGTGDLPRILMDEDANMTEDLMRVATPMYGRRVNQTFYLHNQSYWEISNIEFANPGFDEDNHVDPSREMERGMYITAEDVGQIDHIYINNVYIHGFQGNDKGNIGKESGGIIFFVNTSFEASERRPTWFNDVRITNCTIEDVGRSGFFLLSPWKTREMTENGQWGGRWSVVNSAGEGSLGEFTPSTNIYIGSNIIRRIDGDGIILQCMDGVVTEYNLVDEPCYDTAAAAGIFPYLVSNAVIQYNEVSRAYLANDAQGIEVDALNENVAVKYNYSHQNVGGFVQFCTPANLPSFDSYYCYNISQGDAGFYALLYTRPGSINCSVFNNTVYYNPEDAVDFVPEYDRFFESQSGQYQSVAIYNNIFYRAGEPYAFRDSEVNQFNNTKSLAEDSVVAEGDGNCFANNLFYNFDSSGINKDSAFYQDNLWDMDPLFQAPGAMGDGDSEALIAGNIADAWDLSAYSLQENSPAIDAGHPIRDIYAGYEDIQGNPVDTESPDLGAVQTVVTPVNKSTLEYVLGLANAHVENGDVDQLVPSAQEAFYAVLNEATDIYEDENATQEQVDQAWKDLLVAIQGLGFVQGDKTELIQLVAEMEAVDLSTYEDGAEKEAFQQALANAQTVVKDPDAMASDILEAMDRLHSAFDSLIPLPEAGDKSELGKIIAEAEGYDLSLYVDDANKTNFQTVLQEAKDMYENNDTATQSEIDAMCSELLDAMVKLRLRADKGNLEEWLEKLQGLELSQYSAESAAFAREAIANAQALMAQDLGKDQNALIEAAVAQLQEAYAKLQAEVPGTEDPGTSDPNLPTTGDSMPLTALSVLGVAAVGALLLLKRKSR